MPAAKQCKVEKKRLKKQVDITSITKQNGLVVDEVGERELVSGTFYGARFDFEQDVALVVV